MSTTPDRQRDTDTVQFEERRRRAIAILLEKGIPPVRAEPAPVRVARAAGIRLRPLYFETFACLSVYYGVGFAISWGIVRMLFGLPDGAVRLAQAMLLPLAGGLVFGPLLATAVRRHANKLGLPDWQALDAAGED
ncbi:MAG: DUF6404 family protein [Janthinobacterium lividum]